MGCHRLKHLLSARLQIAQNLLYKMKAKDPVGSRGSAHLYRKVSHKRRNHTNYVKS